MTDWHSQYLERYARLKEEGKSFFPFVLFKDAVAAFVVLGVLMFLALKFGAPLEEQANPADATYNPRPEWYFLFLFQALKYFPGYMEALVAVILPSLAVLVLFVWPLFDTGPARHPLNRPVATGLILASALGISHLTWEAYRSPLTNPIVGEEPLVAEGHRLYRDLKCVYCHAINGEGGMVGPDLAMATQGKTDGWAATHFRDPQGVVPGSRMPKFNLLKDEEEALATYVKSVAVDMSFTAEAPKLFMEYCGACHRVGSEGGDLGPDLSLIGTARGEAYLRQYVVDPSALNDSSTMPGFSGQLTDSQIEDLAKYMASLGR